MPRQCRCTEFAAGRGAVFDAADDLAATALRQLPGRGVYHLLLQQALDGSAAWLEMTMTATPKMLLAVRFGQPIKTRPSRWLARHGPTVVFALLFGFTEARAQAPSVPVSGVDAALIEDIVTGSRVLADFG